MASAVVLLTRHIGKNKNPTFKTDRNVGALYSMVNYFYPLLICYIIIKTQKNIIIRAAGEDYQLLPFHLGQKQVHAPTYGILFLSFQVTISRAY